MLFTAAEVVYVFCVDLGTPVSSVMRSKGGLQAAGRWAYLVNKLFQSFG